MTYDSLFLCDTALTHCYAFIVLFVIHLPMTMMSSTQSQNKTQIKRKDINKQQ